MQILERIWDYPLVETEMNEAGLEEMEEYVLIWHNTIAQYIATRLILDLCDKTIRMTGTTCSIKNK